MKKYLCRKLKYMSFLAVLLLVSVFAGCDTETDTLDPTVDYNCNIHELRISPSNINVLVGESVQFIAAPYDEDGNRIIGGPPVNYRSSSWAIEIGWTNGMATGNRAMSSPITITAQCIDSCTGRTYTVTTRSYCVAPN